MCFRTCFFSFFVCVCVSVHIAARSGNGFNLHTRRPDNNTRDYFFHEHITYTESTQYDIIKP